MILDDIQSDLKKAQLSRDEIKVSALRLLLSEINYARMQKNKEFSDAEVIQVVQREIKKRKEAFESFQKGERTDLAKKEETEAQILSVYLPQQLSDSDLIKVVTQTIEEAGATSPSDTGKIIGVVMEKVSGQAEGARVSGAVRDVLNQISNIKYHTSITLSMTLSEVECVKNKLKVKSEKLKKF